MGYDMYQLVEPKLKAEAEAARLKKIDEAKRALAKVEHEGGSYLLPEEEATLDKDAQDALGEERSREIAKLVREKLGNDMTYEGMRAEARRLQIVPATEQYIKRMVEVIEAEHSDPEHNSYFRLNIWGMSAYREAMFELGMLKFTREDNEGWPQWDTEASEEAQEALNEMFYETDLRSTPDLTADTIAAELKAVYAKATADENHWLHSYTKYEISDEDYKSFGEHMLEHLEHLSKHDDTIPGIDGIKFSSNDGWIVTPEECASALARWNAASEEKRASVPKCQEPYWQLWIQYLENGAAGAGFRVS